jgi:hypothetical protein
MVLNSMEQNVWSSKAVQNQYISCKYHSDAALGFHGLLQEQLYLLYVY